MLSRSQRREKFPKLILQLKAGVYKNNSVGISRALNTKENIFLYLTLEVNIPPNYGSSLVAQMVKNLPATAGDPGLTPGSGRCPGEGNGYPLQYSCLENSMDRGVWWATVHGVTKSENDWEANSKYLSYRRIVNKDGLSVSFLAHYTWALVVFWPLSLCCNRGWIWDTAPANSQWCGSWKKYHAYHCPLS